MPIELYTGQPGNGKTALMMERLLAEAKKAERPLYAAGIDGLQPGLATVLDDPRQWNARNEDGSYLVPDGALIFVDEAWKWFGHLHDATRQATPKHVLDLAEHRHRGLDFIWTTQQPNQLYPFVRGLIGNHHHVVRRFGTSFIDVYSWGELCDDVKSTSRRENAQRSTRTLPRAAFGAYKSATLHTIKARIPLKVWMLPVMVVAAVVLGWWAFSMLRPEAMAANLTGQGPEAAPAAPAPGTPGGDQNAGSSPMYATAQDYVETFTPRIESMPWTAPGFDGREVRSDPQVWCISSGAGLDAVGNWRDPSAFCVTEQGTRYVISETDAHQIARWGQPYNPFREPSRNDDRGVRRDSAGRGVAPTETALPARGVGDPAAPVAAYGGFRNEAGQAAP